MHSGEKKTAIAQLLETTMSHLEKVAREWLVARDIIADFLQELRPDMSKDHLEHNAAAILARLANHSPPILLEFWEEGKS
jgi:hypothetical protein